MKKEVGEDKYLAETEQGQDCREPRPETMARPLIPFSRQFREDREEGRQITIQLLLGENASVFVQEKRKIRSISELLLPQLKEEGKSSKGV